MSAPRQLVLSASQRQELEEVRDRHPKPYMRERASALLKIASGVPLSVVAQRGLLKRHHAQTIREWLARYEAEGVHGLQIREGRGRPPLFSPSAAHGGRA